MAILDRNRPFGETVGVVEDGRAFIQDGKYFDRDGNELGAAALKKEAKKAPTEETLL